MRGFNAIFNHALAGQGLVNGALSSSTGSVANALAAAGGPVMNALATDAAVTPGVVPTAPGPSDVFKEGGDCKFSWTPDASGQWKELNVQLMSGDNWNMIPVTTVAKLDGTSTTNTSYTYPCPDVEPNSAIYFYQFSTPAAPKNLTWTTRFTIAAADGSTTQPANDTQPDGQKISWGVGALVDQSKVVPPPSYLGGGANSTSSTITTSAAAASSSSASVDSSAGSNAAATTTTTGDQGSAATGGAQTTGTTTITQSAAATSGSSSNSTSGANNGALGAQANVVFGTAALGLTATIFVLLS